MSVNAAQAQKCEECGVSFDDGCKVLCPPCLVFAAHGTSNTAVEWMERFRKGNPGWPMEQKL